MDERLIADARMLWDYHRLAMPTGPADAIVGLGSYDPAVAEWSAELWLRGFAPWLLFTGGAVQRGDLLKTPWSQPEAVVFRDIALRHGVPSERILVEPQATHTGENLSFSRALLHQRGIPTRRLLLVTKPNMERRVRATAAVLPGDTAYTVTSPPAVFEDYVFSRFDAGTIVNLMVGDLQRIALYPGQGLQAAEDIPEAVRAAYRSLIQAGYTRHLIQPEPGL